MPTYQYTNSEFFFNSVPPGYIRVIAYVAVSPADSIGGAGLGFDVKVDSASFAGVSSGVDTMVDAFATGNYRIAFYVRDKNSYRLIGARVLSGVRDNHPVTIDGALRLSPESTPRSVMVVARAEKKSGSSWIPDSNFSESQTTSTFGIPAIATYTIAYYANGGSGSTAAQTKTYGTNIALRGNSFTRAGCRFTGWNTAAAGNGTAYGAGAIYTGNAALNLYAQWKKLPTVTSMEARRVDADGNPDDMGAIVEARATASCDPALSVSSVTFSCGASSVEKAGYDGSWVPVVTGARADTSYAIAAVVRDSAGYTGSASSTSATAYTRPTITSVRSYRVDPSGAEDDEGTCVALDVSWRISSIGSQMRPLSLTAASAVQEVAATSFSEVKDGSTASGTNMLLLGAEPVEVAEGTSPIVLNLWERTGSGTDEDPYVYTRSEDAAPQEGKTYCQGLYDTETVHEIAVTLADAINSVSVKDTVSTAFYTMDVLGDSQLAKGQRPGHGIAFGKPCNREGFDVAMDQYSYGEREYPTFIRPTKPEEADLPTLPCMVYITASKSLWLFMGGGVAVQLNERYRIGDIHWSLDPTPPDLLYGGTWLQLSGYMLRPASSGVDMDADADGGSDSLTLALTNIPIHYHSVGAHAHGVGSIAASGGGHSHPVRIRYESGKVAAGSQYLRVSSSATSLSGWSLGEAGSSGNGISSAHSHTMSGATANSAAFNSGSAGGGQPFDNRPAYKNVYAWVRIA